MDLTTGRTYIYVHIETFAQNESIFDGAYRVQSFGERQVMQVSEGFCIFKISRTVLGNTNILPENTTMNDEGILIEVHSLKWLF